MNDMWPPRPALRRLGEAMKQPGMPADKRLLTVAVGAIAAVEREFGPWTGWDMPEHLLSDTQREARAAFRRLRKSILDLAHHHIRQTEDSQ